MTEYDKNENHNRDHDHDHDHDTSPHTSSDDIDSSSTDDHHDIAHIPTLPAANGNLDLEKQNSRGSTVSALEQRANSVISRIRSREPGQTARFTHPLYHTKTSEDVIVDFDGPDDPYRPINWSFKKKCVTTVLYGLTTMGMLSGFDFG